MNIIKDFKIHKRNLENSNKPHQTFALNEMLMNDKLTIAYPTGTGKSRIIYCDLLDHLDEGNLFVIASHRLLLNSQHLNDLLDTIRYSLHNSVLMFVGSGKINRRKLQNFPGVANILATHKLNFNDIIVEAGTKNVKKQVEDILNKNKKLIIVSTYHSLQTLKDLDVHTLYCDEAHILSSEQDDTPFENKFKHINSKRSYFFTATPKDSTTEEEDGFLMNNKDIYGERISLTFKEAMHSGLIVVPSLHFIEPVDFNEENDYTSIKNYCNIIKDSFIKHKVMIEQVSKDSDKVKAKMLIKCPNVDKMWQIYKMLIEDKKYNIKIFAGASRSKETKRERYTIDNVIIDKLEFLDKLKSLPNTEEAIILHYDVLSEGIDVPGITGVMFLTSTLPTRSKILQTIGRSTRLHLDDRKSLMEQRITVQNKEMWIKPYCFVMLPALNMETLITKRAIAKILVEMRGSLEFDPTFYISKGKDITKGSTNNDEMNSLNKPKESNPLFDTMNKIKHEIENIDVDNTKMFIKEQVYKLDLLKYTDENCFMSNIKKYL